MLPFNPMAYVSALMIGLWLGYRLGQLSMVEIEEESAFVEDQRMAAEAGLQ